MSGARGKSSSRVDLGLALLSLLAKPGVELTQHDIAAWCGCTTSYVYLVEKRALRKLRRRFPAGLSDSAESLFSTIIAPKFHPAVMKIPERYRLAREAAMRKEAA